MPKIYFEELNPDICKSIKAPEPSNRKAPHWLRDMDAYYHDESLPLGLKHKDFGTIKSCPAVQDSFNFGYTICMPMDLYLDSTDPDFLKWHCPLFFPHDESSVNNLKDFVHPVVLKSVEGYPLETEYHKLFIKLSPFWGIKTETGYSTWFTHPKHVGSQPICILDAIVDTDKFPARSPYAFAVKKGFKGVIKEGTPIIQIIPFRRENWESEVIDLSLEDYRKQGVAVARSFTNSYKKFLWTRKKFN